MQWMKGWLLMMLIVLTVGNFVFWLTLCKLHSALQDYYEEFIKKPAGEGE